MITDNNACNTVGYDTPETFWQLIHTLEDNPTILVNKKESIRTHPLVMLEVASGSFNCDADRLLRDSLEQGAL